MNLRQQPANETAVPILPCVDVDRVVNFYGARIHPAPLAEETVSLPGLLLAFDLHSHGPRS